MSSYASWSHFFILGLILVHCTTLFPDVRASNPVNCRLQNISSRYQHCGIHPDGVHDLDCFGKHKSRIKYCEWKAGRCASCRTYTLIIQQQHRNNRNYCIAYYNITEISQKITVFENYNMTAEVYENSESTNCTKAVFKGSLKNLLRCGPPYNASFSRHSSRLVVNVSWQQEDMKAVQYYSVRYKALGSRSWSEPLVQSENGDKCTVENLNSSLVYTVQIQCVTNDKCSQCPWSEDYTVPSELTTQPVIVSLEDTDITERKGCRLLSLTWKFPTKEQHDGYYATICKASGEAPCEQISIPQPEIRLILSYSAYQLNISAVNKASSSPAVSQVIPQREGMSSMGAEKLNVSVHSDTSFTVYWEDDLIENYVCYSVEWMKRGHEAAYMSFYQSVHNYRTLSPLPEPLEPYQRYSITLHTRPDRDTCDMKHVNNSESTYGRTQFYFTEGTPISAPTNISCYNVTLNSAELQWSSIPEEDLRGFLLGYIIYYTEYHHGGTSTERNIRVDPLSNSHRLGNLQSGTAYEVQISGLTQAGAGVRSTAQLFNTDHQGFSYGANITAIAVVAALLIFGPVVIKRAKVVLWPSMPNPGNSNAMQKLEEPCELELLESMNTLKVEELDTNSLQIVPKEEVIPASTAPSLVPLLHVSEGEGDWIQRDATEDATGHTSTDMTAETFPDIQQTEQQSSPVVFSSGYTTMEMFQQGMPPCRPANISVCETMESDPEDTVGKSGLNYIGQFSTSPTMDSKEMVKAAETTLGHAD